MSTDYAGGLIPATAVTTQTAFATIPVNGRTRLNVEFTVASAALTAFEVRMKPADSTGSTYATLASSAPDYTAPPVNSVVRGADSNLAAATVAQHWLVLDVTGMATVQLRASSGTSSAITGSWGAA